MIDEQEASLMSHAIGAEIVGDKLMHRADRNYFATSPGSPDDVAWTRLADRQLAELARKPVDGFPDNLWRVTDLGRGALRCFIRKDAMGNRLVSHELYYIEEGTQVVGNCVLWWGKNSRGYTCSLDDAGVYTGLEAASIVQIRGTDYAWPQAFVLQHTTRHVRSEPLTQVRHREPRRDTGKNPERRRRVRA